MKTSTKSKAARSTIVPFLPEVICTLCKIRRKGCVFWKCLFRPTVLPFSLGIQSIISINSCPQRTHWSKYLRIKFMGVEATSFATYCFQWTTTQLSFYTITFYQQHLNPVVLNNIWHVVATFPLTGQTPIESTACTTAWDITASLQPASTCWSAPSPAVRWGSTNVRWVNNQTFALLTVTFTDKAQ